MSGVTCEDTGLLPYLTTKESDHSTLYADIDATKLFKNIQSPIVQMAQRKLTIGNQLTCNSYIEWDTNQAISHNMEAKVDKLIALFHENGKLMTAEISAAKDSLDNQLDETCTGARNQCSCKGMHITPWFPELKTTGCIISYWSHRLRSLSLTGDIVTCKLGKKAGIKPEDVNCFISKNICKTNLRDARKWLTQLKQETQQKRLDFQGKLAEIAATRNKIKKAGIIRALKHRETQRHRYQRILYAVGKTKYHSLSSLSWIPMEIRLSS